MKASFTLQGSEFTFETFKYLKSLIADKTVTITFNVPISDTEYLLGNEANKTHLLNAIEEDKQNGKVSVLSADEFEALTKKLLNQ